ncbi:ribonuclease H-like domain, reverse transcriptase, RNA-dependent DNA polymerase [Tanacetum coccineum]
MIVSTVNAAGTEVNAVGAKTSIELPNDPNMPELEDIMYSDDYEDVGAEADMNNLDTFMPVSPILTTRVHKHHPVELIIGDLNSAPQTRRMIKNMEEHGLFSSVQQRTNHKDFQNCLFACFLSQEEPKKVIHALKDPSWIEAMQDELLQFKIQKVWTLVELVAQGYTKEEGINYDKVFAPIARIEAIRLFLAYVSFKDFVVYLMDVKSAFLYDKYVTEILKKFGFTDVKTANTPMKTQKLLLKDEDGEEVDVHLYRSMIRLLMYLTSSRPDIMFAVCACARYQVNPKISHFYDVKRIFRYLKGQPKLGLWYPKDLPFNLVAYTDSDYAGASLDMKSTTGGCQFLRSILISWQCKKQTVVANSTTEAEYVAASSCYGQNRIGVNAGDSKLMLLGINLLLLEKVNAARHKLTTAGEIDEAVNVEMDDSLVRAATTATSLDADSGGGPRRQETIGDTIAQTRSENVSKPSNDSLLARVIDLENIKTTQDQEITSLKLRVKKLEKKGGSRTHKLKILYKGRKIHDIDADEDITLENVHDAKMFDVNDLDGDEVVADKVGEKRNIVEEAVTIPNSTATITNVELTLAQTLVELKSARPKTKGVVMQEPNDRTREAFEEEALRLQAKFDEEDRLAREKAQQVEEANIAWDDIQAKIDADYQLAKRLQAQEQHELTIEEKSTLFVQLLKKRKKYFAAKRVEEKRNMPPTRA